MICHHLYKLCALVILLMPRRKTLTACVCWRGERDTTADEAVKKLLRREKDLLGKMR